MNSGIYSITNTINNKVYVGSSKILDIRFLRHKTTLNSNSHKNIHLQRAWNKYGSKFFRFDVIEFCEESLLTNRENFHMNRLKSMDINYGYNMVSADRRIMSDETKEKIRRARIGKKHSESTILKMRLAAKRNMTPELKQKLYLSHKGKTVSEETRQKMSKSHMGNTSSLGKNLGNHNECKYKEKRQDEISSCL